LCALAAQRRADGDHLVRKRWKNRQCRSASRKSVFTVGVP